LGTCEIKVFTTYALERKIGAATRNGPSRI
jgi:hypothetical protein